MKREILKWTGIVLAIFIVGFFAGAVFSCPGGPLEGMKNPLRAISHLWERIAPGGGNEEINLEDYPYLATLPPELEGMVEVRYSWYIGTEGVPPGKKVDCSYIVKNISSDRSISYYELEIILKDINGEDIAFYQETLRFMNERDWIRPGQLWAFHKGIVLREDLREFEATSLELIVRSIDFV